MSCSKCGNQSSEGALYCSKCGTKLADTATTSSSEAGTETQAPPPPPPPPALRVVIANSVLWNPKAAALWSIVLSPAFGAFLHAKNWEKLGYRDNATKNYAWAGATIGLLGIFSYHLKTNLLARLLYIGLLVAWYFWQGRIQSEFIEREYGANYQKQRWGIPLLIGFICGFAYNLSVTLVLREQFANEHPLTYEFPQFAR